jgi:hypothetical protein
VNHSKLSTASDAPFGVLLLTYPANVSDRPLYWELEHVGRQWRLCGWEDNRVASPYLLLIPASVLLLSVGWMVWLRRREKSSTIR